MKPRVSVVIPAYRASRDIGDALASVFAQTFTDLEVIVVNDGSPDTMELEAALGPYAGRIRYIVQDNRGAGAARNVGIREATGSAVALLDADDRWHPDFLRRQIWYLDAHPECDVVYCDAVIAGDSALAGGRFMDKAPSCGDVTLHSLIAQRCNIILSTVVARRKALVGAGLFDESLRRGQDFDLWLRLALHGAVIRYQRHVLGERRVRADGLSGDPIAELQRAIAVLERFGRRPDLEAAARTAVRSRLMTLVDRLEIEQGKRRLLEGNFAAARYHFSAPRRQPLKLRLARLALRVAPRLVRTCCQRLRPAVWPVQATAA
ncbi:MAG TPA: glycosyltransferase family A protein [Vicinamibacterales bacterium]|nr:glycosyltransferase family A protein [Vicinamibacterales bacterium]